METARQYALRCKKFIDENVGKGAAVWSKETIRNAGWERSASSAICWEGPGLMDIFYENLGKGWPDSDKWFIEPYSCWLLNVYPK